MDSKISNTNRIRITGGWPLVFLACLVIFVDSVGYGVVVPVLPRYGRNLGISDFQIGVLFATYAIAILLVALPIGVISDRLGRKPFILFGMFAMAGAFIFYAFAGSYFLLVVARILDGLTAAATWTVALALVGDRIESREIGEKMGYVMAMAAVGGIAGPPLGGLLYRALGYRAPFYAIALICVIGGLIAMLLEEDRSLIKKTGISVIRTLKTVMGNRIIMVACLVTVITTTGIALLEPTFPLYLEDIFSMSPAGIGLMFGVMMISYAVASPVVGRVSDRVGRKGPIIIGLIATALFAPLLTVFGEVVLLYLMMGLLGVTFTLFGTPTFPLVTDELSRGSPDEVVPLGTGFGLINFFWSLGYAIGPLIGGALMGWLGLFVTLLIYSALLLATTLIVGVILPGVQSTSGMADS